jgi:hypothetical protein
MPIAILSFMVSELSSWRGASNELVGVGSMMSTEEEALAATSEAGAEAVKLAAVEEVLGAKVFDDGVTEGGSVLLIEIGGL